MCAVTVWAFELWAGRGGRAGEGRLRVVNGPLELRRAREDGGRGLVLRRFGV